MACDLPFPRRLSALTPIDRLNKVLKHDLNIAFLLRLITQRVIDPMVLPSSHWLVNALIVFIREKAQCLWLLVQMSHIACLHDMRLVITFWCVHALFHLGLIRFLLCLAYALPFSRLHLLTLNDLERFLFSHAHFSHEFVLLQIALPELPHYILLKLLQFHLHPAVHIPLAQILLTEKALLRLSLLALEPFLALVICISFVSACSYIPVHCVILDFALVNAYWSQTLLR